LNVENLLELDAGLSSYKHAYKDTHTYTCIDTNICTNKYTHGMEQSSALRNHTSTSSFWTSKRIYSRLNAAVAEIVREAGNETGIKRAREEEWQNACVSQVYILRLFLTLPQLNISYDGNRCATLWQRSRRLAPCRLAARTAAVNTVQYYFTRLANTAGYIAPLIPFRSPPL
jgi:hypothetical protein